MTTNLGSSWFWLNAGEDLIGELYFLDELSGWAVTDYSSVLKTTDGGFNWERNASPMSKKLNSIFFIDKFTGWAVGDSGLIIKTTNGGN